MKKKRTAKNTDFEVNPVGTKKRLNDLVGYLNKAPKARDNMSSTEVVEFLNAWNDWHDKLKVYL